MKVLLAENRPDVRSALRLLLEQKPELTIISEVAKINDLLEQLDKGCPDLVLLDWDLPGLEPADVLLRIRRCCPNLEIIAISSRTESEKKALAAGADTFVSKADTPERLLAAIDYFLNPNPKSSTSQ